VRESKKADAMSEKRSGTFEAHVEELDKIVKRLESGDVDLDESVELFKKGRGLVARCQALLQQAQEAVKNALEEPAAAVPREEAPAPRAASTQRPPSLLGDGEIPF
jgi:exodeoxyribonuclease VII small subunit